MDAPIYLLKDYKKVIQARLRELKQGPRPITLRKIAEQIPIQYTYLSKVMNHDEHDLSEDHLFSVCRMLGFQGEDSEYILTLRAWKVSRDAERKKFLYNKLEQMRRQKKLNLESVDNESVKLAQEMRYLFNPLCMIVHIALTSQILRKNPQVLCSKLGIGLKQLKEILKILADFDVIELNADQVTVKAVNKLSFHLSRAHPLTRVHQSLLKNSLQTRLGQTEEEDKQSIIATFTLDAKGFQLIQDEFQTFLKKLEGIAGRSKNPQDHQNVYSLNFDLFKWI